MIIHNNNTSTILLSCLQGKPWEQVEIGLIHVNKPLLLRVVHKHGGYYGCHEGERTLIILKIMLV